MNAKKFKSNKHDSLIVNSSLVHITIPEHLEDFKKKENLIPRQDDSMKHHSVMLAAWTCKGKFAEPSIQFNFEGAESSDILVTVTEQQKEDNEEMFKKLNVPWFPEGASSFQEGKVIDSEKKNIQKSIK